MPRFPVKPIVRLSKKQWKALVQRIFEKESKVTPKAVGKIMGYEPPIEKRMGTLWREKALGGGETVRVPEHHPIVKARAKYFAAPEEYVSPYSYEPPTKSLTTGVPGMAGGIAYERLKFEPVISPGVQRATSIVKKGEVAAGERGALRGMGITPEDIRPGVKMKEVLAEKGARGLPPKMSTGEMLQVGLLADYLWKYEVKGSASVAGKHWRWLLGKKPGAVRQNFKTSRDYFISAFARWRKDPIGFKAEYPEEAALLGEMWGGFAEDLRKRAPQLLKELGG